MFGFFEHGLVAGDCRVRVDEVGGIERCAACFALVAISMVAATVRACAYDISVGEKLIGFLVVVLHRGFFDKFALVI